MDTFIAGRILLNHKPSTRRVLKSSARAVARAVKRRAQAGAQNVYEDEEILLALILKEDAVDQKRCKEKLKEYCKALADAKLEPVKVHQKLGEICTNDAKCTNLQAKINPKCILLKNELEKILPKGSSGLTDEICKNNEQQCVFLEETCSNDLVENCNKLRNLCYQKKRDEIAKEVLLRVLRNDLSKPETCEKKLNEICPELEQASDELVKFCLNQKDTCKNLVTEGTNNCGALKTDVEAALVEEDKLREKCLSLLKRCYFYVANCKEEHMIKCTSLQEKCHEKGIIYIAPGPHFDPTMLEPLITEDIGLEELYKEVAREGILIGKPLQADTTALLSLLVETTNKGEFKNKCNNLLTNRCKSPQKHKTLEDLCDKDKPNGNGTKKCEDLEKDIQETCTFLTPKVINNRLFDKKNAHNGIVKWEKLPTFLSNEECARLESYCFYFGGSCPDGEKVCMNVKAACYKKGLEARANNVLQEKMRGWLHGSNETWRKKFQEKLVEVCKELKEENKGTFPYDELLVLCVQPLKALRLLTHDHQMRTVFLREQLDKKRDFPGDKDCKELGRKCQELEQDSNEIRWPCYTLEQQCERLGTTELLKTLLLSEHKGTLKDHAGCEKYLKEKCNLWTRRGDGRFSLVCAFQNATCKLMVDDVRTRCEVFKENTKDSHIIKFLETNHTQMESLAGVCPYWHSYCDKYGPNCPSLLEKDTLCASLKKYCGSFYERKALEDALKGELQGNLKDNVKCNQALERYCTQLKELNNKTISGLCKDNTDSNPKKNDDQVRKELCLKLIAEVAEQCRVLPAKLEQEEKDLKNDLEIFKKLKEKAEDAMKKSNLVLSVAKTGGDNAEGKDKNHAAVSGVKDTMKHVKIVRRGAKDVPVTELEARALDLAADVLARYVELRERCTQLNSDCGIRKDCKEIEEVCKNIDKTCDGLKPLDIKSQEIVTQNVTTTTTKTVGPDGKTVSEQCKSIQTTDTWITRTSTHTSTSTSTSTITSTVTLTRGSDAKRGVEDDGMECGEGGAIGNGYFNYDLEMGKHDLGRHRRDPGVKKDEIDEDHILALILKDNIEGGKCKQQLEGYCQDLKKSNINVEEVDPKLKGICEDGKQDGKCNGLQAKVKAKCTTFKTELEKVYQNPSDDNCKKNEQKCLFLEGACPTELKDECNKLRNKCYQKKRDRVAEEVLLRALSGSLKEENSCKQKLKQVCPELSGESDELTVLCFDEEACKNLMTKKESICESLKGEVEKLLNEKKNEDELKTKCPSLLKKCYFYSTDCKDKDKLKCKELESTCEGKGIVYRRPGSDFEPTRPGLTVTEEIELQELYGEAAKEGVYIGRPPARDATELLLLLSRKDAGSGVSNKCKKVLEEKCKDLKEHELLKGFCNKSTDKASDNGTKECDELEKKAADSAQGLTTKLKNKYLVDTSPNTIIGWHHLSTFLTEKDCRTLESDCLYLEGQGGTDTPCSNLRAACYKRGLYAIANEELQSELRGSLQGSDGTWLENLQKGIVNACKELKEQSDELFVLCMDPKNAAFALSTDLRMKAIYLKELLDERRDFPTKKDCKELEKKCEELGPDSREIGWPCHTLNQNCRRLESAEQLEEVLLKEKTKDLDVFDSCLKKLSERCNTWNRRRDRFTLACLAQNVTCKIITKSVKSKCAALDGHMKTEKVVEEAKKNNGKNEETICANWMPYCNKYMSSCENLAADEGHTCKKLKEQCKSYLTQRNHEDILMSEFKGHLSNKNNCVTNLDKYCTEWDQAGNQTLKGFCSNTDATKDNNTVRDELCEKLVERVQKKCQGLKEKLEEEKKELDEQKTEYEKIKKETEKVIKEANLVLSRVGATDEKAAGGKKDTKRFRLVRRDTKVEVTEKELKAFDLTARAFNLYLELKEKCDHLREECGFKEECSCKDACDKIDNICKVKPLEVKEYKVQAETKNITTTVTKTETVGQEGKTLGEQCKSIQTTDVWVTKTSTHTSTSTSTSTITSTVTLTSTRRCKPTRCTTGDEAGDVTPSGGLRITGWSRANEHGLGLHVVGQNLAREVARAVKRRAAGGKGTSVYEDVEYLLTLVLKKEGLEQKCKEELKRYCEELRNIDKEFSIYSELKEICKDDGVIKCTNLKTSVDKKYNSFKTDLGEVAKKQIPELTDEHCSNQEKCLFLENAYPDLKENCNTLRTNCYQKKREEVAEEALLRALRGNLDNNKCNEKLKEICPVLIQGSDELLEKCVNSEYTCQHLVQAAKDKCKLLKKEVETTLSNNELKENVHSLLEKCYFYGLDCQDSKCDNLKDKCKKEGIVYVPPGSHFDPTRPEPTVMEKVGLEELYREAAEDGVLIEKPLERDPLDLLLLLSKNEKFDKDKCKTILSSKCKSIEYLGGGIKELCGNASEHDDKCEKLDDEFKKETKALTTRIENKHFKKDEVMLWSDLPDVFNEYDCTVLQSDCFYYGSQTSFEKLCKNVKAGCYKRGLDILANEALLGNLRGKFNNHDTWLKTFPKDLINVCTGMKEKSKEIFALCLQPMDSIFVLLTYLNINANILQEHLDAKRDLPTRQHCTDLLKKCADLEQDSKHIEWPCRTLRHHCARLGVAEHLEEVFLQEKVSDLDKFESCVETLRGRCSGWGRRGRTRYALGCVAPNATCTYLTGSVESKCATLKARMETNKVLESAKKDDERESICRRWMPFCSKFMYSCKNLTDDGEHTCKKLEEQCRSFIKQQELEVKLLDKLKGNLGTQQKCKAELDRYCTEWANATNGFETLCIDKSKNKKNNDDFRNGLCDKLIEKLKEQCPTLEKKLTEAKKELEEKTEEYEDIKKKADDSLKKANLILSRTKATNGLGNKEAAAKPDAAKNAAQFRLVRRNLAAKITEDEIKAFDLVSQALSLYVELKEECQDLLKDCGFKEECDKCKDACNTIENKCKGLKPLEVTEHKVETSTTTTTTTTTTTIVGSEAGKAGTEQCTSIRTTDTWVTKTSTHTSTSTSTSTITSTVTLTSTRKCRPTKCTTEGEEAGEVKPSRALRMRGWGVMKGLLLGMMISVMI
ncbi:hypothetical protein PMAC_003009 [Pneumocystis sp. 'macacae']|nr:hypothetical protein PMAC_003009 [Pneumocystis sp. 'macacae']